MFQIAVCFCLREPATGRLFFDVVSAWLVVGAKHDNSELVCMEASLDVVDADHSQAGKDVVQQVEGNYDKVACIPEHGIVNLEVVYEMGLSACDKSEKNTGYMNRVCSSRRWRNLVFKKDVAFQSITTGYVVDDTVFVHNQSSNICKTVFKTRHFYRFWIG